MMAKLFVSYSRRDSVAARKLIEAFKSIEQDVWVDWESIPPAVDWLEQILRGIEESDAFIFMISPDSIASEVCKVEINWAAQNNKRIIPIVLRDVQPKDSPENIRKLNWTFIRKKDDFDEGLAKVKTAIELDLDWLEEHRRLQVRSLEWHRKKDASLLLRGRDLRNAGRMITTATSKDPTPTELQQKFIQYSLQSERNRIVTFIATGVAVVALTVLSFLALEARDRAIIQQNVAETARAEEAVQRQIAETARAEEERQRQIAEEAQKMEADARALAEKRENEAEAQRSAARAQIYQSRPGELFTSTLLAIDSMRRNASDEAEEILRRNIRLLPLPVIQFAQEGRINALAFNRDRSVFVTGSADGTVCAWQIQEEVSKVFCTASSQPSVNAAAISRDGSVIAIGDQTGVIQILDSGSGEVLHAYKRVEPQNSTIEFKDLTEGTLSDEFTALDISARHLSFHPTNGQQLAVAYDDGQIPVFNINTGDVSSPLFTGRRPNVMGFSRDGTRLVVGSDTGNISVWNLSSPGEDFPSFAHRGGVQALAFNPRDNTIATGGNDNTAIISLSIKKELFRIANQPLIRDLAFSPDGSRLVTASADRRIRIWNTLNGVEQLAMSQDGSVTRVVFSANGRWLATTGDDRTVRVWDSATGEEIFQIPLSASGAQLAFCNDDRWLVSTDSSGAIEVWDVSIMTVPDLSLTTPAESLVDHVQYSLSGDRLAVSSENNLWLLTPDAGTVLRERELGAPASSFESEIKKLVFSPHSTRLGILTHGNEVAIFDVAQRKLSELSVSTIIQDIAFSPDGQQIMTSDADGNIQVWDAANAQLVEDPGHEFPPALLLATSPQFMAMGSADEIHILGVDGNGSKSSLQVSTKDALLVFNGDGSRLASTDSRGAVTIWESQDGEFTALPPFQKERAVSLAFDPPGNLLAVGTARNVYLLDPKTGKELARIPHLDTVNGVSFSADGKYLATGSSTLLKIWQVDRLQLIRSGDLNAAACTRLFQNFSQAQWQALFNDEAYRLLCEALPEPAE